MQTIPKKFNLFNASWDVFASIRLSVITLILLAATSVVGTLIPQNQKPVYYKMKYNNTAYELLSALNIFDMYHSWWFQFLLLILAINIVICSMDRFPSIWKIIRQKPDFSPDRFRRYKAREELIIKAPFNQEKYKALFKKKFGSFVLEPKENGFFLFGEKGRWTRLGVWIVHASVLLLLLGGMIGALNGFEGKVTIFEGETADLIRINKSGKGIKLDFQIRCDKFELSHYVNGAPKEYKSDLSIIENGQEVLKESVIVNKPLRYKGINIFQSEYKSIPLDTAELEFVSKATGMTYQKKTGVGKEIELPENLGKFILKNLVPSYNFRGHNIGASYIGEIQKPDGKTRNVLLPIQYKSFDKMFKPPVSVSIINYDKSYYTGLQVTKDPGVFLVYAGFFFMIIGTYIAFFMSHQSLCMEITQRESNRHKIMISGKTNKNRIGMRTKITNLAIFIKNSQHQ